MYEDILDKPKVDVDDDYADILDKPEVGGVNDYAEILDKPIASREPTVAPTPAPVLPTDFQSEAKPERMDLTRATGMEALVARDAQQAVMAKEQGGVEPEQFEHYKNVLNLEKRFPNTKICEYNQYFQRGKMIFTHGTYHGLNHARQMSIAYGTNVMYGHLHTNQVFSHSTVESEQPREATSVGCMCIKNPPYMKNRPSAWCNSFAIVTFLENGEYAKEIVNIINSKAVFRGKLYVGVDKNLDQLV